MFDWTDELYTVSGAYCDEENCLEITGERVDDLIWRAAEIAWKDDNDIDDLIDDNYEPGEVNQFADDYRRGGAATLWAIPLDSTLYELLLEWYRGDEDALAQNVRGYFTDDGYMYFTTGCGYNIMSADLLGGTADGIARREFDDFVDGKMN